MGQSRAAEQAEQVELRLALHLVQRLLVGEILDADDEALAQGAELLGRRAKARSAMLLEIGEAGDGGAPSGAATVLGVRSRVGGR